MKKMLTLFLLLTCSLSAKPRADVLERSPIIWIPMGIGSVCASFPGSLPGCGIYDGLITGWFALIEINGVTVTLFRPA